MGIDEFMQKLILFDSRSLLLKQSDLFWRNGQAGKVKGLTELTKLLCFGFLIRTSHLRNTREFCCQRYFHFALFKANWLTLGTICISILISTENDTEKISI